MDLNAVAFNLAVPKAITFEVLQTGHFAIFIDFNGGAWIVR